jgi:hypothetical protein
MVDLYQFFEHVPAQGELLHVLVAIRLPRQCRLGQRMLQLDRTRQPQFEEGFGEGGRGHWPRYRPRLISANVQIGAVLLCKGGIREYRVWSIEYREMQKDMVTGDGHGHREFRNRPFGHRELAPGFRRLKAEGLTPERLTTVAVTRHLE